MRQQFFKLLLFSAISIASIAVAETNSEISAIGARNTKYSQKKEKNAGKKEKAKKEKECTYTSECDCSKYQTCCAMLPLPVNRNGHVFMEGEYLYWKTYALFPYSTKRTNVTPFDWLGAVDPWSADVRSVEMSADSGYRLTLGFYLSKCWSLRTVFRQYDADGSDSFSTANAGTLGGESISYIWSLLPSDNTGDFRVNSKQRYREKVWDIDFARVFSCYRFTLNSFMGVRFAWLKSDSNIDYRILPGASTEIGHHIDINNRFNLGVGLHVGMDSQMDLPWGFGFYGHSQLAVLIGQFKYRIRDEAFQAGTVFANADVTQMQKVTDFQTNLSLGTGLNWGHHFQDCGYYLGFKVGYEVNVWPNFITVFAQPNVTPNPTTTNNAYWGRSVLTHGLTLSARFDF